MLDIPPVATWKITRTYHIKANDKTHALRKLKQAIEQGYDYRYLTSQIQTRPMQVNYLRK